jgi:hypothetical protein
MHAIRMATSKRANPPAQRTNLITAADVMAGAVVPMRLTLTVTIRPGSGEEPLDTQLARHLPKLLRWANESPANAAMLLVDPVSAVARSGVKLSRAEQLALEQQLGRRVATEVLPAGTELAGLNVKVMRQKRGGRRG